MDAGSAHKEGHGTNACIYSADFLPFCLHEAPIPCCAAPVNGCVTTDNRVPALKTEPLTDCTLDSGRLLNIAFAFGVSIFVLVYAAAAYRCIAMSQLAAGLIAPC